MRKSLKPFLIVFVIAVLALSGIALWKVYSEKEPNYKGKPLAFWLWGYDRGTYSASHPNGPSAPTLAEANEAVRAMGTNTIPVLLQMLEQESPWRTRFRKMLWHLSKAHFPMQYPGSKALGAFHAFNHGDASNAVPALIKIMQNDRGPFQQTACPDVLAWIGPPAEPAIPALLQAATHTNAIVRNNAVYALGRIHARPELVLPALTKCLKDTDPQVQMQAAGALKAFGRQAQPAVPALIRLWRTPPTMSTKPGTTLISYFGTLVAGRWLPSGGSNPAVAVSAADAIKAIDPESAAAAGIK